MERCFYPNGNSTYRCSDYENCDAESRIQDGADQKEASVVTVSSTVQLYIWCCFSPRRVPVFYMFLSQSHLLPLLLVTVILQCVESCVFVFVSPITVNHLH